MDAIAGLMKDTEVIHSLHSPLASAPSPAGPGNAWIEFNSGVNAGICVALQVVTAIDCSSTGHGVVTAADKHEIPNYAVNVGPEECDPAGFPECVLSDRRGKPESAASIAT